MSLSLLYYIPRVTTLLESFCLISSTDTFWFPGRNLEEWRCRKGESTFSFSSSKTHSIVLIAGCLPHGTYKGVAFHDLSLGCVALLGRIRRRNSCWLQKSGLRGSPWQVARIGWCERALLSLRPSHCCMRDVGPEKVDLCVFS